MTETSLCILQRLFKTGVTGLIDTNLKGTEMKVAIVSEQVFKDNLR